MKVLDGSELSGGQERHNGHQQLARMGDGSLPQRCSLALALFLRSVILSLLPFEAHGCTWLEAVFDHCRAKMAAEACRRLGLAGNTVLLVLPWSCREYQFFGIMRIR